MAQKEHMESNIFELWQLFLTLRPVIAFFYALNIVI
jgi:hypothetical protein